VLADPDARKATLAALRRLHAEDDGVPWCATVMPDHVHVVLTLGSRLTLGQWIAKAKHLARSAITRSFAWQTDAFEHHLRINETPEDYGLYTFLNPYREKLVRVDQPWPGWWCPDNRKFGFLTHTTPTGCPQADWCRAFEARLAALSSGE
jgi:REP element-mobilizing transposase RayT